MRYVPIPPVEIDPRNERELLEETVQKVRDESNGLLTDLSESDPIRAILEGQVFAYGEFLSFFNQIPEALLIEWIGPFLGSQRRAGSSSRVEVTLTLQAPSTTELTIPSGFTVDTEPSLNGGVSKSYSLIEPLVFPVGSSESTATFRCTTRGVSGNCLPNSVTIFQPLSGISSVRNKEAGYGGTDIESLQEAKERFLSLIRRRVPVSETDWLGVFQDLFGVGTTLFLKPQADNTIIFQVLKPGRARLSETEKELSLNIIRNLVPAGTTVEIQPIEKTRLTVELEVDYANLSTTPRAVADNFRTKLLDSLVSLPSNSDLSSEDITSWVSANLGIGEPYVNPKITSSSFLKKPSGLLKNNFRGRILDFSPAYELSSGDLIQDPSGDFFPVITDFNPRSYDRNYYSSEGFLRLRIVQEYEAGTVYEVGSVLADGNNLRVVERPFEASGDYSRDISLGNISAEIFILSWVPNTLYPINSLVEVGSEISAYIPTSGVGSPVWQVTQQFTSQENTNDLTNLQAAGLAEVTPVIPDSLQEGQTYPSGTYIKTPSVSYQDTYDPSEFYVSREEGVVEKFFLVESEFTQEEGILELQSSFLSLELEGLVREVKMEDSLSSYSSNFYRARIPLGTTVYSGEQVYLVAREFTPFTQNVENLVSAGYLIPIPTLSVTESIPLFELNVGDFVTTRFRNGRKFFRVNTPFTRVYNLEAYKDYLDPVNVALDPKPFSDPTRVVEDTILEDGEYYKVIRPFTPEGNTVAELESLGYLQRLEVEEVLVQKDSEFLAEIGNTTISVKGSGSFFYSSESQVPLYKGRSLF